MKNYDAKQALSIILSCAKAYNEKLNNKHFLIVYQNRNIITKCCVGFRRGKFADFPVTLYHEDIKKLSNPTCKVLAIFSKQYNTEYYNKCTYLSKGIIINELPNDVKDELELSELS